MPAFFGESLLSHAIFLLYINDLSNNMHRYLVKIYARETKVYRYISKNLDDQNLAVDLSSDIDLVAQRGKLAYSKFNTTETKL